MALRLEQIKQFGPCIGHHRVVKSKPVQLPYEKLVHIVLVLNDKLGVERKGKVVYPRIGQTYYAIRRS